jgi:benzoyl-CoA-dihydrodiol lyase
MNDYVRERALALADKSDRPQDEAGIALTPLNREISDAGYRYDWVEVRLDAEQRVAHVTIRVPDAPQPDGLAEIKKLGVAWWPLAMARELDDALLMLRHNHLDIGTLVFRTEGAVDAVLAIDKTLDALKDDWFVRETVNMLRRTLARLDVSSRSLFALIEEGSCFAGSLFEIALAADRSYMLDLPEEEGEAPKIALSPMNFGPLGMVNGLTRLATRFHEDGAVLDDLRGRVGEPLDPPRALELGLITVAPDDLDWEDEVRLAIEERAGLSPDALTGMEASLRFPGRETQDTRIFGRLSAWQNWIFNRPNAVGESGALKIFGSGRKAKFDWERV